MLDPRKPFADALRSAGLDFNRAGVVAAFDALMDKAGVAREPEPDAPRKVSDRGISLIHLFEGLERKRPDGTYEAYLCPAGVWTIGRGNTGPDPFNGGLINRDTVWTRAQCDEAFKRHLSGDEKTVSSLVTAPTTQGQFDALVSFQYNTGALGRSTLLKKHNAGDYAGAAAEFGKWVNAKGKAMGGLIRRRAAEVALYRGQA